MLAHGFTSETLVDLIHAGTSQVRYRAQSLRSRLQTTNMDFTTMLD